MEAGLHVDNNLSQIDNNIEEARAKNGFLRVMKMVRGWDGSKDRKRKETVESEKMAV